MPNNLGLAGSALSNALGGATGVRRPRTPSFAGPSGIGSAGSAITPKPPPRTNSGLAGIGGSLLGAALGGGKNSGPGAAATTQAPAAPAPSNPGDQYNIGLVPADELAKAQAQSTYDTSTGEYRQALNNAAMRYGDPSIMSGLGLGTTVNPNSVLAEAALKAQLAQQQTGNARESAGTFFSSLHDQDLSNISSAQQRQDLAGYQAYQNALGDYTSKMTAALNSMNNAVNAANLDERQTSINSLPDANSASGGFQGGSTNVTGKVPVSAPSGSKGGTPKAGKTPTVKAPPKTGAPKTTKPGSGRASGVTPNTPKSSTPVKAGVKKISGGKPRG